MVKRKHRIKILALIAGLLLCGFLFLMNQMQSAATDYGDKSVVYKYELTDFLKELGYINITSKLYSHMRHEILNETKRMDIYEDVVQFIDEFR